MATEFDVAVLGGGMAGSAAAIAAAQRGARVGIITGSPGASAMFSGAWHGPLADELRSALAQAGFSIHVPSRPLVLPHPNGTLMRADAAPDTQAHAQPGAETTVIGIAGLPGFDAELLRRRWRAGAARVVTLEHTPAAGWAPASLATWLDRHPDALTSVLREAVRTTNAKHVILPAVLGMRHDTVLPQSLARDLGCGVSEALAMPPSIVGWRLQIALQIALRNAGVTVFEDRASAGRVSNRRVEEVKLSNGDVVCARTFVLATGKYVSGGIEANGAFREVALDCPVWVNHIGEKFTEPDALMLTDPVRTQDQPLLRAGVHANEEGRPVDRAANVVYENVLVAGSIRAGWTTGSHGIGHAASDGWNAGVMAIG